MSRYANTPLQELLAKFHACTEAREWVDGKDLATAWGTCNRPDWMLWLLNALGYRDDRTLRLYACWCVRQEPCWSLLTDEHSRSAVEVAERYARGKATSEELAAARDAAGAASADASAAASAARSAASAARSAAWVDASAAAGAARAAWYAAWYAAGAAASSAASSAAGAARAAGAAGAAAEDDARAAQADRLREVVPVAVVERLADAMMRGER